MGGVFCFFSLAKYPSLTLGERVCFFRNFTPRGVRECWECGFFLGREELRPRPNLGLAAWEQAASFAQHLKKEQMQVPEYFPTMTLLTSLAPQYLVTLPSLALGRCSPVVTSRRCAAPQPASISRSILIPANRHFCKFVQQVDDIPLLCMWILHMSSEFPDLWPFWNVILSLLAQNDPYVRSSSDRSLFFLTFVLLTFFSDSTQFTPWALSAAWIYDVPIGPLLGDSRLHLPHRPPLRSFPLSRCRPPTLNWPHRPQKRVPPTTKMRT